MLFYISFSSIWGFWFLFIFVNTWYCLFFNYSHPSGSEVVSLCSFDFMCSLAPAYFFSLISYFHCHWTPNPHYIKLLACSSDPVILLSPSGMCILIYLVCTSPTSLLGELSMIVVLISQNGLCCCRTPHIPLVSVFIKHSNLFPYLSLLLDLSAWFPIVPLPSSIVPTIFDTFTSYE